MAGSEAERQIRDAVAAHVRRALPNVRIIHELVAGGCRADLAAVARDRLVLFEIKSERDTLSRLQEQVYQFTRAAHSVVVVAHQKWFDTEPYSNGSPRLAPSADLESAGRHADGRFELWCYPEPDSSVSPYGMYRWALPRPTMRQPEAFRLLDLLWRDELADEAARHRVSHGRRAPRHDLIVQMAWHMTGREIAEAVCRQLRQRSFPEADAPMADAA